jgi:hypothetical protein
MKMSELIYKLKRKCDEDTEAVLIWFNFFFLVFLVLVHLITKT